MKRFNQTRKFGAMSLRFINMIDDGDGGGDGGSGGDSGGDGGQGGDGSDGTGDGGSDGDAGVVDYFSTAPEDWRAQALSLVMITTSI